MKTYLISPYIALQLAIGLVSGVISGSTFARQSSLPSSDSVLAGVYAKIFCSAVFVSKRFPKEVKSRDLFWLPRFSSKVDRKQKRITVSTHDATRIAIFRQGLGCTLLDANGYARPVVSGKTAQAKVSHWKVSIQPKTQRLVRSWITTKNDSTRAIVVIKDGSIVAESYAPGFLKTTALPGYSMSKSVTNALTGILINKGLAALSDRGLFAEWSFPGVDRADISLEDLLRMNSGLEWNENYADPLSDVMKMLSGADTVAYALERSLSTNTQAEKGAAEPGESWSYSSGSYALIADILRRAAIRGGLNPYRFPQEELFERIGMPSAIIEPDAAGNYVMSAFMYATARDWARFGQFLLQEGEWDGHRILPPGWVSKSAQPTISENNGAVSYGAGFWLNSPQNFGEQVPKDMFYLRGFEGQYTFIVPSKKVVILRLGLNHPEESFNPGRFIDQVLNSLADENEEAK